MNAIRKGALVGFRDNRNYWQIHTDDLSEWMATREPVDSATSANSDTPKAGEHALRIAVLEVELKARDQRISDLERDRDSWKEQAQSLARRPRRWWPF